MLVPFLSVMTNFLSKVTQEAGSVCPGLQCIGRVHRRGDVSGRGRNGKHWVTSHPGLGRGEKSMLVLGLLTSSPKLVEWYHPFQVGVPSSAKLLRNSSRYAQNFVFKVILNPIKYQRASGLHSTFKSPRSRFTYQ